MLHYCLMVTDYVTLVWHHTQLLSLYFYSFDNTFYFHLLYIPWCLMLCSIMFQLLLYDCPLYVHIGLTCDWHHDQIVNWLSKWSTGHCLLRTLSFPVYFTAVFIFLYIWNSVLQHFFIYQYELCIILVIFFM